MPHFIFLGRSWQGILILPIFHFHFVCEFVKCVKMHFCFRQQNLGPVFPYNFIFLLLVTEKHIASANNTTGLQCLLSGSVRSSPGVLHSELGGVCSPSGWWLLFFTYFVLTSHVNNPISLFHSPLPSLSSSSSCSSSLSHPLPLDPLLPHGPLVTGRKKLIMKESKQSCDFLGQLSKKCSRMFKK